MNYFSVVFRVNAKIIAILFNCALHVLLATLDRIENTVFSTLYSELREYYTSSHVIPINLFDVDLISNLINKGIMGKQLGLMT